MAYAQKRLNILSLLVKEEAVPGVAETPAAGTDAVMIALPGDTPNMMPDEYDFDGSYGDNPAGMSPLPLIVPNGRSGTLEVQMYWRGYGSAYSGVNVSPNRFHALMKGCGHSAAVTTTGGSEKIEYTLQGDDVVPTHLTMEGWGRQVLGASNLVKSTLIGGLGSLSIDAPDLKPPLFKFSYKGIFPSDPAEAAFTLPTLTQTPAVPAMPMTFSIDGTALKTHGWSYEQGRDLSSPRVAQTDGHLGFIAGGNRPMLKVTIEDTLFATFKGYTKRGSAATAAIICGWNQSVQYNRFKITAPTAQIAKVTPAGKGKLGLMDLEILCTPSSVILNNGITFTTD
jgi:hypothetical protein